MLTRSLWRLDEVEVLPPVKYERDIKLLPREGSGGVLYVVKDSDRAALGARRCCGSCLCSSLRRGVVMQVIRKSVSCVVWSSHFFIGEV